jgi:hypothetical protein
MGEDRVRCISPGCGNLIQPATAKRTGGYCGPCDGKRKWVERQEYLRKNRKDVDLYAGITDPVEILRITYQRRKPDPLIHYLPPPRSVEEMCGELSLVQAGSLMSLAAQALRDGDRQFAEDVARVLAGFTDYRLDSMLETWVDLGAFWPSLAFRSAGRAIRDRVLDALRSDDVNANHALQAAAWIGDDIVVGAFRAFDSALPSWATYLYIPPSGYARTGGWEVVDSGRRELTLDHCYSILPEPPGLQKTQSTGVFLAEPTEDHCPWCGGYLVNLLRVDGGEDVFREFGISGACLEVRTCEACTNFGFVFGELDEEGHGHWDAHNVRPAHFPAGSIAWNENPWSGISVRLSPRSKFHAADDFLPTTHTQIGGLPAWVQDIAYPNCHKCGQTMVFIAQIDCGQFPLHEGVYYAFLCRDCRITATAYQQT